MSMPLTVPPSWTLSGKLVVVYATSAPDAMLDASGYEEVLGTHDRYVQQIRDDIAAADLGTTTVKVVLARKPVAETLVGMGQALKADEIIVGLHRRGWLRSLMRRSVSSSVLKLSDRPVVVVPESIEDDAPTTR